MAFFRKLRFHLLSVSTNECNGGKVVFENGNSHIMKCSQLLAESTRREELYVFNIAAVQLSCGADNALMVPNFVLGLHVLPISMCTASSPCSETRRLSRTITMITKQVLMTQRMTLY